MSGSSKTNNQLPWQLQVFAVSVRKKEKWRWAQPVLQQSISPIKRCLDVGSGVGTLSVLMERLGGQWIFTETDAAAARETKKIVNGKVLLSDIYDPVLAPASYDIITIFDVIEHVPEPILFVTRAAELLTPGGILIMTTPADDGGWYFWRRLAERFFGIDKAAHGHIVEGFSAPDLTEIIKNADLHLVSLTQFSGFFTEMVELAYNAAYIMKNRMKQATTPGYNRALSPASGADVATHRRQLLVLKLVYPILRAISLLDQALGLQRGYEWGIVARKRNN